MELPNWYTKVRSMTNLVVDCSPFNLTDLQESNFIALVYANRIPPHLMYVSNGQYFSLEHNGLKIASTDSLMKTVELKRIPLLLVQVINKYDQKVITSIFQKHSLGSNNATCLDPIKELFGDMESNYIYELLPQLMKRGLIEGFYALNMDLELTNNQFEFQNYTKKEIFEHINRLNQRDAKRK